MTGSSTPTSGQPVWVRAFAPVYEASSEEHPDIVFGKVDTEVTSSPMPPASVRCPPWRSTRDSIRVFFQERTAEAGTGGPDIIRFERWTWSRSAPSSQPRALARHVHWSLACGLPTHATDGHGRQSPRKA